MKHLFVKFKTAIAIGPYNLMRVVIYRLKLYLGLIFIRHDKIAPIYTSFFDSLKKTSTSTSHRSGWQNSAQYFGWINQTLEMQPPNWYKNILTGTVSNTSNTDWSRIPDFDGSTGDIKLIWEVSRFDWVLSFSQRSISGDSQSLDQLNLWLSDWCAKNPPYYGINWKCGQEASIRVMHLAMASVILSQYESPTTSLIELIRLHLQRIAPTLSYALAQDNNHGTSEAAALYIGGSWLERLGIKQGRKWRRIGEKWLQERVGRLVEDDGSFSQYSVVYHRVFLDTISMVEIWRLKNNLTKFSSSYYIKVSSTALWLNSFTDPLSGDVPNIGANDGARLLSLTDTDFRDFRPSVQLSCILFARKRAYSEAGSWDEPLSWLDITSPSEVLAENRDAIFANGGYAIVRKEQARAYFRFPKFRFRPSHADALHVDLWVGTENILRDSGTYSYNTSNKWLTYFPGTISHNTVQFDDRDQMPRLGRFLFGNWLKTKNLSDIKSTNNSSEIEAGYTDGDGASHHRKIMLFEDSLHVTDRISGFRDKAILRWRLRTGKWLISNNTIECSDFKITITASVDIKAIRLVEGWESRYYMKKTSLPVLEIEVDKPCVLYTKLCWTL